MARRRAAHEQEQLFETETRAIETGVLYRDDNLTVLKQLPDESIDLIYLDPPFFSNRHYEIIWGEEAEIRSFKDRWDGGIHVYVDWMAGRVSEMHRVLKQTGSLYLHCDPHASHHLRVMLDEIFGAKQFQNEVIWYYRGGGVSPRRWGRRHDNIFFYTKGEDWTFNVDPVRTEYSESVMESSPSRYDKSYRGDRVYEGYRPNPLGKHPDDVWPIQPLMPSDKKERIGWPTQKPETLLEQIILASSKAGDIVLDPFCGCGTTVAVAERLQRQWIGVDISDTAIRVMTRRLLKQHCTPKIMNAVQTMADLKELKPLEFQNWVIDAINGTHATRDEDNKGIDGFWFFTKDPVQVKDYEHVGRPVVDKFETAVRRSGHTTGYVIGFSFTKDAMEEAARVKKEGLDIRLVRVAEILLLQKRPHSKLGPYPGSVEELPMQEKRRRKDMPSADEVIDSEENGEAVGE